MRRSNDHFARYTALAPCTATRRSDIRGNTVAIRSDILFSHSVGDPSVANRKKEY